ncbi:MAG TPA: GspH/FimT family pseudopilin [Nevskiaceae bacterium]|nr:GspH/FimT family pseudopilin [Nevskiaceae bacterium]
MKCRGFTLIELLTALAVAAIALTMAVPAFTHMVASSRLTRASNSFVSALNTARMQAIRGNEETAFCSNLAAANSTGTLGAACGTAAGAVYADISGTSTAVLAAPSLPDTIQLGTGGATAAVTALRYGGDGLAHAVGNTAPYTGLVADVYSTQDGADNHRCIYLTTGSVINTCSQSTSCTANAPATCQ